MPCQQVGDATPGPIAAGIHHMFGDDCLLDVGLGQLIKGAIYLDRVGFDRLSLQGSR